MKTSARWVRLRLLVRQGVAPLTTRKEEKETTRETAGRRNSLNDGGGHGVRRRSRGYHEHD